MEVLTKIIGKYEKVSSAVVNWGKSEGYIIGKWEDVGPPKLPCGLQWGREGIKALGVFIKLIFSVKKLGGIAREGVSPIVQMELAITTIVVQRTSLGHQQLGSLDTGIKWLLWSLQLSWFVKYNRQS